MQNTAFRIAKGRKTHAKKPHSGKRNTASYNTLNINTIQRLRTSPGNNAGATSLRPVLLLHLYQQQADSRPHKLAHTDNQRHEDARSGRKGETCR